MFGQFIQALHKFGVMVLKLNINKTAENFLSDVGVDLKSFINVRKYLAKMRLAHLG